MRVNPLTGRPGPAPKPPRDGDKIQARMTVNYYVRIGRLPRPNDLACVDCGHVYSPGGRRHEYDHYLGYASGHHVSVQAVCAKCQRRRSMERGEISLEKLKQAARKRSAGRKMTCLFGHSMERFKDGKWRCRTCRNARYRMRGV
jgi:hypothetical protein